MSSRLLLVLSVFSCVLVSTGCRSRHPALFDPSQAVDEAPEQFKAYFETTRGPFTIEVNRGWAPRGADRFYNLVRIGFFEDTAFFRVIDGFVVQFGINGDPEVSSHWKQATIPDDPVRESNVRGSVTFAMSGPGTRTSQVFINLSDNLRLDRMRFAPVGRVIEGMDLIESLYSGYGERAPRGNGPSWDLIYAEGNSYLRRDFPNLDYIVGTRFIE